MISLSNDLNAGNILPLLQANWQYFCKSNFLWAQVTLCRMEGSFLACKKQCNEVLADLMHSPMKEV